MAGDIGGTGFQARAGTLTLLMVASTTKRHILRELADGPKPIAELREEDGSPAEVDVGEAGLTEARITPVGREMLFVTFTLEQWLQRAPRGPLTLGSEGAVMAIASLVCAWSSTVMHTLARGPQTASELDAAIERMSVDAATDQLESMQACDQVTAHSGDGADVRYEVTDWLREAIAPLAAAARLERRQDDPDTAPIDELDIEAAFLLTLPLLRLDEDVSGLARLAVSMPDDDNQTGAMAKVAGGRVISSVPELRSECDAWAAGCPSAWLDAVIEQDLAGMEFGGDLRLGGALLGALHEKLFGIPVV